MDEFGSYLRWAFTPWPVLLGLASALFWPALMLLAARRHRLRDAEREELLRVAQTQHARVKELNEKLSLQSLEIADQAETLAEKRAWLESVLTQLPVGALLLNVDGVIEYSNPRFDEVLGLTPEHRDSILVAWRDWPVFRPDGMPIPYDDWAIVRAVRTGEATYNAETHVGRGDGSVAEVAVSAAPIRNAGGGIVGGILLLNDLSPLRRAEQLAQQNEDRLRFALRSASMIAWEWDLDTGMVHRSTPLEDWLGLPPHSPTIAGAFVDRMHPDDRDRAASVQGKFVAGEMMEAVEEYRFRRHDDSYMWLESRGRRLIAADGKPAKRVAGVLIDITVRKHAEERLRLLESAVVHAQDAVIVLEAKPRAPDVGRAVLYVNDAFTRMTGYDRSEILGRSLHNLRGPKTDTNTLDRLRAALEVGGAFKGELLNYHKDGREVWMDVSLVPVDGPDRKCTHFVMIQRDVTLRRWAEEALIASEARFRGMFEATSAGVSMTDASGKFISMNPAFAALLGRPDTELLGHYPSEFTHADDWAAQQSLLAEFERGEREQYSVRKRYLRPDGSTVWTELNVSAVRSPGGELLYGMGVTVDVTERARLEEQLRQAQKMEALGQLAGGIAHDFNNLLTAVLGNLSLVRLPADDPNRGLLRTVDVAASRAADLTRKLLGYARRNQLLVAAVEPAELFGEVVDILRRTLDPRIEIRFEADSAPPVVADATLLVQAVFNLCLNARDAMPNGGRLTLAAHAVALGEPPADRPDARAGAFVQLSVSDTGHGMSRPILARLFEPFFTTKGVGRGTGLGLPMVHGIMRQHDGWVEVESEPGRGAAFHLVLPASAALPERAAPPRLDAPDTRRAVASPGTGTVLLVDDEGMIRSLARVILEQGGYDVIEAEDGLEAVETFRREADRIALVILDVTMPRMSGPDAIREILAHRPEACVLFSSGYSADDLSEVHGAKGLLSKPYRPQDLLAAVHHALASEPVGAGL